MRVLSDDPRRREHVPEFIAGLSAQTHDAGRRITPVSVQPREVYGIFPPDALEPNFLLNAKHTSNFAALVTTLRSSQ